MTATTTGWDGYGEVRVKDGSPSWTVLIFAGVDSIGSNADLTKAFHEDMEEIDQVGGGGAHHLDIFVEQRGRDVAHRHHWGQRPDGTPVKLDTPAPIARTDRDNGNALAAFVASSLGRVGQRSCDRTILVLWGHAYEFAFGRSFTSDGAVAALDFAEIGDVLDELQGRARIDIIGFDACDVATVEMACQLRPFADYLLASQTGIPLPGWPYHLVLDRLKHPYGALMSPAEFGAYAVRRFCASYDASTPVTLSLINLAQAEPLAGLIDTLAVELALAARDPETCAAIASVFFDSQTEPGKPFVDTADLCLGFLNSRRYPRLSQAAQEVGNYLVAHQGNVVGKSATPAGWPLVAEHGRNSGELVRLNGLSIYAPHVEPPESPEAVRQLYEKLTLSKTSRWSQLVHELLAS